MLDVGKISGNGTLKINNASVQIVSAEQVSPDKTAYFDGIKIAALNKDLTFNGDREAKTAMLDGGNPVLQKQALRVRRKTARLLCPTGQATLRRANT